MFKIERYVDHKLKYITIILILSFFIITLSACKNNNGAKDHDVRIINDRNNRGKTLDTDRARDLNTTLEQQKANKKLNYKNLESAYVARVLDGDTIKLQNGERVRFIGIDTPETVKENLPVEPYGKEASDFTKKMLTKKYIYLERDVTNRDKYGRLLRYVYLKEGIFYNKLLVEKGLAKAQDYPPNIKYSRILFDAQMAAEKNKRGMWRK